MLAGLAQRVGGCIILMRVYSHTLTSIFFLRSKTHTPHSHVPVLVRESVRRGRC